MTLVKLSAHQAFVWVDVDGAERHTGLLRRSAKVTQANAKLYARRITYTWALADRPVGGAAAGLRSDDPAAVDEIVGELAAVCAERRVALAAGPGVDAGALAGCDDWRSERVRGPDAAAAVAGAVARSAAAAVAAHLGGVEGRSVALWWSPAAAALAREVTGRGGRVVAVATDEGSVIRTDGVDPDGITPEAPPDLAALGRVGDRWAIFGAEADVFVPAPGLRSLTEQGAERVRAAVVCPVTEQPIATKPFHILRQRGVEALPDALTLVGEAVLADPEVPDDAVPGRIDEVVGTVMAEASTDTEGPWLGACRLAETRMAAWWGRAPRGRPFA